MDDLISRQAALTALNGCTEIYLNNLPPTIYKEDAIKAVKAQPSATDTNVATTQPKYDEWCTDCREYDHERHSCPRWNRVIRETVEDMQAAQPGWIQVTDRLPDKSGLYLVTEHTAYGVEVHSRYWNLRSDGSFWSGWHGDEVLAWQPLPTPCREGGQDNGSD